MPALHEARIKSVALKNQSLELIWNDGKIGVFHYLWLRDNCPSNFHKDTKERTFNQLSVSEDIRADSADIIDNTLHIAWSENDHNSIFDSDWLREYAYSSDFEADHAPATKSWDNGFLTSLDSASYEALINDDEALYRWMKQLDQDGLILVTGMPSNDEALTEVATRIDYQRQTNFGITFEVKTEPKPINLAYTALALPLHTDLSNQETPPGYQFLHCLANDSEGGDSIFADGLRILEDLRQEAPEHFQLLAEHAIPFRFQDDEHDIRFHHPVINLDHQDHIVELKYNAHLAGIFDLPEAIMHDYYLAYRNLMQRMSSPKYKIKLRLQQGVMAVFDNRRVLHGRESYNPNGRRHLRGCYVDRTEFKSRLRILAKRCQD